MHRLRGHSKPVTYLAFSRDGSLLASSGMDSTVKLWDATTGEEFHTLRGHDSWVMGVAFSRDGTRLASAGNDNCVIVWEPATGRQVRRLNQASMVWLAIFSADGQRLATCSDEGTIKLWEVETGIEILTLCGQTTRINCLSFSPDGTRLASCSADETIRIWDGRPWTQEAAAEAEVEREALGRLDFLFTRPLRKVDVVNSLRNATGITPQARRMALTLADRYREETDPERYHQASWAVLRQPYLNAFQYRFALQQAETACQLAPGKAMYRTTLGAAQYRVGDYKNAEQTLIQAQQLPSATAAGLALSSTPSMMVLTALWQADEPRQTTAANLAFLAMTYHRLGQKDESQAALARLRKVLAHAAEGKGPSYEHMVGREADVLLGGIFRRVRS